MAHQATTESEKKSTLVALFKVESIAEYESKYDQLKQPYIYKCRPLGHYYVLKGEKRVSFVDKDEKAFPKIIANPSIARGSDLNQNFTLENTIKVNDQWFSGTTEFVEVLSKHFNIDISIGSSRKIGNEKQSNAVRFVTFRNNLNKIAATPFCQSRNEFDSWQIDVCRKGNLIFLEIVGDSKSKHKMALQSDEKHMRYMHWGRQFESLVTVDNVVIPSDTIDQFQNQTKPKSERSTVDSQSECKEIDGLTQSISELTHSVNQPIHSVHNRVATESVTPHLESELQFIFESTLNAHQLIITAEIDCVNEKNEFIEVKTTKFIPLRQPSNDDSFHSSDEKKKGFIPWYKVMKFWIQANFAQTGLFCIGWRDENGEVVDVTNHTLAELWETFVGWRSQFKREIAMNFASYVLDFIAKFCVSENAHYRLSFEEPFDVIKLSCFE